MATGDIRPKDLPVVTSLAAGDRFLIDGDTTRSIAGGDLLPALGVSPTALLSNLVDTVSTLQGATVLAPILSVTTQGYHAAGDGGGATYIRNDDAPVYITSADGQKWQNADRNTFNIAQYGAVGGNTDDSVIVQGVLDEALEIQANIGKRPIIEIPPGKWTFSVSIEDKYGFHIRGNAPKATYVVSPSTDPVFHIFSDVGSGIVSNFILENIEIHGPAISDNPAVKIWNALHFSLRKCLIFGWLDIQGSGNFVLDNIEVYGTTHIGNGFGTLTNSGPGTVLAGQFQGLSGNEALLLQGDLLAISFHAIMYSCINGLVSVRIDGPATGTADGSVSFYECHAESNYDATNLGIDFQIGESHKFGHVSIYGGNFWGHGDGTNYRGYWLHVIAARSVIVNGVTLSNQAQTGYSQAGILLESSFPGAGDTYDFRNFITDITGNRCSDANGKINNFSGNATNVVDSTSGITIRGTTSGSSFLRGAPTGGQTFTLPTATSDTLVSKTSTDTLTNKTLTAPAISGRVDGGSAAAGNVGEVISSTLASGSATALTSGTAKTITSISLTAGEWEVDAIGHCFPANTTSLTAWNVSISQTNNTLDPTPGHIVGNFMNATAFPSGVAIAQGVPPLNISLSTTTTIYLVMNATFTVSTCSAFGIIRARRVQA